MEGEYIPKEVNTENKEEKKKESKLSGVLRQSLVSDLLTLLAGLFIYFASGAINQIIGIVVGTAILLFGALNIINCVRKNLATLSNLSFLFGIFLVAVGIFVICSPLVVTQTLTLMIGIVMFVVGVNKLMYSWLLKKSTFRIWSFSFVIGCLLAIFGLLIMINPFANITLTKIVGILLIITAVSDLINLFIIKKESSGIIELHW